MSSQKLLNEFRIYNRDGDHNQDCVLDIRRIRIP